MTARRTTQGRTRAFYDGISGAYDLIADSSEHAARDLGLRALGVSSGERVLEIGCGTGHALVSLAGEVGPTGQVRGVDVSSGMMAVARRRIESAGLRNVALTIGDARVLCFRSSVFDAVFMSFTLELFERTMPDVLAEVRRVLCIGGRLGIVAMSDTGETNAMIELYAWLHRRWPQFVDCRPINLVGALQAAPFQIANVQATAIWGLPVIAAVGIKGSAGSRDGSSS
jgi:demethylmenaquinone methyltransferase/2-methoxy-6-polyprenyl-1,4-benzoquinol methylase